MSVDDSKRAPEPIQIPAGTQVTLLVTNQCDDVRSLTIDELDVGTGDIQPNETGWIAFTMPDKGTDVELSRAGTVKGKLIPE
ncbi:MAG: hypothetical protein GEU79_16580 [Acidimicrobiia bacterium]|nr:hypothetical protein [Acidimicrobiia bacterium]